MTADSRVTPTPVSYAQRIADLATERGKRTSLILVAPGWQLTPRTFDFVTTSFRDASRSMRRSALASARNQARASTPLSTSRNEPRS